MFVSSILTCFDDRQISTSVNIAIEKNEAASAMFAARGLGIVTPA